MERDEVQGLINRVPTASRPGDAEPLARLLVRAQRLTEYQAGALLQGKSRGLVLGNYLILDRIGKGGMGLVFKALHRRMKRVVALKVLPPSFAKIEGAVLRFRREAEAVARLNHSNIVAALDADEFNGVHFFAMEYVEGTDLARLVREGGPMPLEQAIACVLQAAHGLRAAHARGIYHRDIKPSNLIMDRAGNVKVLDLGLARIAREANVLALPAGADAELSRAGGLKGTVDFMSPEQAYNATAADERSDIYSLGCTFYYLLTGRAPYSGPTVMACLVAHREHPIPSLRAVRPEVSEALDLVLRRMLAKAPEGRYPSIDALIAGLGGRELAPAAAVTEVPPARLPAESASEEVVAPRRARVWLVAGLAALALAAGGFIVGRRFVPIRSAAPAPVPGRDVRSAPEAADTAPTRKPSEPVGLVQELRHGDGMVQAVAVSDDGALALSGGNDGIARPWSLKTRRPIGSLGHDGPVFAVAIAADGRRAVTAGGDRIVRLWDLKSQETLRRFERHTRPVKAVALSPGGGRIASGGDDGSVRIWDVETGQQIAGAQFPRRVGAVCFAGPDRLVIAGGDRTVRLLSTADASELAQAIERAEPFCLAVAPDRRRVLWGGDGGRLAVAAIDAPGAIAPRGLEGGPRDWARCVAFLPGGRHAVAGYEGGKLLVWDLERGRVAYTFEDESHGHLGAAVLPDGAHLLTSDDDGRLRLWRLPRLEPQTTAGEREGLWRR
jgi:hypothetical protein